MLVLKGLAFIQNKEFKWPSRVYAQSLILLSHVDTSSSLNTV